jgi:hypothetical protein
MIRLMFVGKGREAESILSLKFDCFLDPAPDHTFVYYGDDVSGYTINRESNIDLLSKYKEFGIDTSKITVVPDKQLLANIDVDIYKFGGWIAQQFIKFLALDSCTDNHILLQDCDVFAIKTYKYFENDLPVPLVLPKESHSPEYYTYITKLLGIDRQTEDCYVTDFMPVNKNDWISLKAQIEKMHNKQWFGAIYDMFVADYPSAPNNKIWFSEYEILGNWAKFKHPNLQSVIQSRLGLIDMNDSLTIKEQNCVFSNGRDNRIMIDDINDIFKKVSSLI